jgi:hypothetical protein
VILEKIRLKIANRLLRKKISGLKRQKTLFDFASAKYAGIVCASENETSINVLKDFLGFLHQKGIRYFVLGYFAGKKIPEKFLFWQGMEFITQNDLNIFFIPKADVVDKFVAEPFDMLINCSIHPHFPVEYVAQTSVAKCKVGVLNDGNPNYDLMIDIGKQPSIKYFLDNVKLYLSNLRNPE